MPCVMCGLDILPRVNQAGKLILEECQILEDLKGDVTV